MKTHYFIALALPEEIKLQIAKLYSKLTVQFPFHKPVHELDYHITLAFLGEQSETKLKEVMEDIKINLNHFFEFPLIINGYGIFGNDSAPRIFWNRLETEKYLFDLQHIVANGCNMHGIQLEKRPYHPHITIARKWAGKSDFNLQLLEAQNPLQNTPIYFTANKIILYRTNLNTLPKYEDVFSITLKKHERR